MSQPAAARPPIWLIGTTVSGAVVLGVAAFLLWGFGGAGTLLDMIVAFCS